MHLALALLTFGAFIALDFVLSRRRAAREARATAPAVVHAPATAPAGLPALEPVWVSGYALPEGIHYHRGHTWARVLDPDTVLVGLDDFSSRMIGAPDRIALPSVGAWQRQGERAVRVRRGERVADLVAPVEGEVVEVNRDLKKHPGAVREDPYGRGWLYKVRPSGLGASLRNLLVGPLAHLWTEDARDRLELRLMALSGSVLQDGGQPAPDFADHLEPEDWDDLVETFLLTGKPRA